MKEEEDTIAYLLCLDGVFNTIRGLGEKIEESMVVQKVLRSPPLRLDARVSTLEERKVLMIFHAKFQSLLLSCQKSLKTLKND